ncbi:MAG: energy-coupling factor transporter transmembrane protein EcfT [Lachnospiraceae bacterium]|nr:energy-coupling factor transporter transmembrane protein EcfT [Lachnospiraceae bacterium]
MLRDITLGQYYKTESVIHSLDPRVKVIGVFVYIISLFMIKVSQGYIPATVFLILIIYMSKVPPGYMVRGLKPILILMIITGLFNLFLTPGEELVHFYSLRITKEGVRMMIEMILRLAYLILGTSVMTLTTTPNQLTDAIEKLFSPLKIFRFPVHEIAMMMSIALSFIPILVDETDRIMKAQMARGADFENRNLIKKMKAMIPVLVPLFVSAFRRANDLSLAMEARCYRGGDGRTRMKPLRYKKRDVMAYIVLILYIAVIILTGKLFGQV